MFAEFSSTLSATKVALDIAKAANGLSNHHELVLAVSEVMSKLVETQNVAMASLEKQNSLMDEVRSLEEEAMKHSNWEARAKNYSLQNVGTKRQVFAQVFNPPEDSSSQGHWACVKCFEESKIFPLSMDFHYVHVCPNCGNTFDVD